MRVSDEALKSGAADKTSARPRVGFLGVGWIGRHRMEAMLATGAIEAAAYVDPFNDAAAEAAKLAPQATRSASFDALLDLGLDAVVIATPSAAHAEQSIRALERGVAVFCQKPLGRSEAEVRAVIEAARQADRLLAVDLSYRFTESARRIRDLIRSGDLGRVHAVDLVFHNAYGPDKPWFYDRALSGGGCVMDLGVHLVDLAFWMLEGDEVAEVVSHLSAGGEALSAPLDRTEDYAVATLVLKSGTVVRLACSWRLQAGQDAVISASFYGTQGGAEMRNVGGSFYDFVAERFSGTSRSELASPPDAWNVRAAADFAVRLAAGERFDPSVAALARVAQALDRIYA
ncbi:Gfo/Idh/MocA family protein [Hansschlegelia quercus]|uniref:Gfo/Idh/MocA family oxidoreductase n=1 Tax=Hansschlegelia quercus TaxID=2528245 RepID=A0A4Q9GM40_9HYPH|nr:Gfo/Idh/MocA family oxidoreductase [Hansschlegelia quercus]TBN51768.1 Gfo/Idh/MocA family oxidoreductase [Hansschlegelia quercus]